MPASELELKVQRMLLSSIKELSRIMESLNLEWKPLISVEVIESSMEFRLILTYDVRIKYQY